MTINLLVLSDLIKDLNSFISFNLQSLDIKFIDLQLTLFVFPNQLVQVFPVRFHIKYKYSKTVIQQSRLASERTLIRST